MAGAANDLVGSGVLAAGYAKNQNEPRSGSLRRLRRRSSRGSRSSGSSGSGLSDLLSSGRRRRSCVLGDTDSRIFVRTISIRVSSLVANSATAIDVTRISTVGAEALTAIRRNGYKLTASEE